MIELNSYSFSLTWSNSTVRSGYPRLFLSKSKLYPNFNSHTNGLFIGLQATQVLIRPGAAAVFMVEASVIQELTKISNKAVACNTLSNPIGTYKPIAQTIPYPFYYTLNNGTPPAITGALTINNVMEEMKRQASHDIWLEKIQAKFQLTNDELDLVSKNSFIIYFVSNKTGDSYGALTMDMVVQSGSLDLFPPVISETDWVDVEIVGPSKPRYIFYKPNSFRSNGSTLDTTCVTSLKIKEGSHLSNREWIDLQTSPCPGSNMITDYDRFGILFSCEMKHNLEYIRLKSNNAQEVSTALMFRGDLAIPEAKMPNEMARFSQLPNKDKILREIVYEK